MKVLIIEDDLEKVVAIEAQIHGFVEGKNDGSTLEIDKVDCLSKVHQPIHTTRFDLIIFDIYLPNYERNGTTQNCAKDIILAYKDSINANTDSIVLTQQPNSSDSTLFNEYGVTFIEFNSEEDAWKMSLAKMLDKVSKKLKFDFLIFCALTKERKAYKHTKAELGKMSPIHDLDCQEIIVGDKKGLIIKPYKMGLISMAITSARAIELFEPEFVGMSGICAGYKDNVKMLNLVLCDMAWEYQAGKFKNGEFVQEPYQTPVQPEMQVKLSHFLELENLMETICDGIKDHQYSEEVAFIKGPIASGSSVIADNEKMAEVQAGHRKMAGLEMEVLALYESASQATCKPQYLAIKTVTDFGNDKKSASDDFQDTGSIMSARCMIEFIENFT